MEEVKAHFPFKEDIMIDKSKNKKLPDEIMNSVGDNRDMYVSFVLHYLEWTFRKEHFDTLKLCDDANWICSNTVEYSKKERIRLFQQDIIYVLTAYIIDRLRKGLFICNTLEQFSIRAMRFNCLKSIKHERDVQNVIATYLFDNGNESHREENSGNGNPDFLISDEEELFVVEVKYLRANSRKGEKALERWTSQLRNYMAKYSSHHGVLYIVTERNCEYVWRNCPPNMSIMNVYIGNKKPSDLVKPDRIEIEV
jgi:hypothetical protein